MIIRLLTPADKAAFAQLNSLTMQALLDPSFLIPFSADEIDASFAPDSRDVIVGVFDHHELVAISGYYFNLADFEAHRQTLAIDWERTAELGGCMTLPAYRGKGYMLLLNQWLTHHAATQGLTTLIATAHPQNSASNASLCRLGMSWVEEFVRHDLPRNLYVMEI